MIWVDDAYGLISWKMDLEIGRNVDTKFGNPDFVAYAESFGGKHSAHSRVVMGSAGFGWGYGENACAGGRQGLPSMRSCRTSMAFLPCLRAVSM